MNFVPDEKQADFEVPFFEDVTAAKGWAGHATSKTEEELMSEIAMAIGRLGGIVTRWVSGSMGNRNGYRVYFNLQGGAPGQIDVLGLPLRTKPSAKGYETKKKQAIKMALFNLRNQMESLWRMQQLISGYFGLLPMMLANESQTIGQIWVEQLDAQKVLPSSTGEDGEIVDGEFEQA